MAKKGRAGFRLIGINLLAITTYFLLALLAKAGFSWQSSAITLWPASGLANALTVATGLWILPGVAIGNFIGTAFDPNTGWSFQPFMPAVAIAAAGQSALVRYALIRHNLLNDPLTRISRLMPFLLWIGPLGNWPASITFFIYQLSQRNSELEMHQMFTGTFFWWLGDSLGSLLFLPFFFLFLPFKRPIWAERKTYLLRPLLGLITVLISAALTERLLLERINLTLDLLEPLQNLRLLTTFAWTVLALGVLGLILQIAGKSLEQEKLFIRSRLAADAAGAVIHEIGQPLIRLRLRLERLVKSSNNDLVPREESTYSNLEIQKESMLSLEELDSIVINTRSIKDLTLAGIKDTDGADLKTAISRVSTQLRPELNRLDQDLNISIEDQLPKISSGQIQLQAAIRNLLANASNAAGENGVIRVNVRATNQDYLCVEIEDSGCGFDYNCIPTGEKRAHSTTGGMGLGLMIVRRVIDDNGGKISFDSSNELGGAKVTIWLHILPN
tara:strand:- start:369 stop:1868 length:1500 start_codon:yes stop_codon:yes gene_type:complete